MHPLCNPLWLRSPKNSKLPFLSHQPKRGCNKSTPISLSSIILLLKREIWPPDIKDSLKGTLENMDPLKGSWAV